MNGRKSKDNAGEASLNIYKDIFEHSIDAIFITTPDGGIQSANPAACGMFGYTEEEIIKAGRNGILDLTDERLPELLKERKRTGKFSGEIRHKRKDGSVFPAEITSTIFKFEKGKEHTITIIRDISARVLMENKLAESEKNLRALINAVDDSLFLMEPDGKIILANNKLAENFGKNLEDVIGTNTYKLVAEDVAAFRRNMADRAISEGCPVAFTDKRADRYLENRVFPIRDEAGKVSRLAISGRDITLHKEADHLLSTSNELLGIINRASSKIELINSITGFLRNTFGFEAVGIRLREGDDFPYYQTSGLPEDFVLKENHICSYDTEGELLRDSEGNPLLECMCGNVICGRFDPAKPFFTENGSFWTNSTSGLLATTLEDDRQSRTRNRCNGEGYESVGLFPLRSGNTSFGLLQVNDRQKGVFTPSRITVLEILGDNISIALDKFHAEENLKHSEEKYRLLSEQSGVGVGLYSKEGIILYYNSRALKNLGGKSEDFVGKSLQDVFGKKDGIKYLKRVKETIRLSKNLVFEDYFTSATGNYWFASNHSPFSNSNGEIIGVQVVSHDITERKLIESQLIQTTSELRELTRHMVEVREEERTAIARDLHDDLGQKLTALNMDISWLKSRIGVQSHNVENKIKQMVLQMEDTIDSIQKISFGLRPSILDDLGLVPAIEWQLTDFHKSSGLSCTFSRSPNNISVDANISLVVFRIIQEALTNIARHSGATKVNIKLSLTNGILEISVKDNGSGITQKKIDSNKSFGLIGMRERLNFVNGDISITGKEGEGTRLHVSIPVGSRQ